MAKQKKIKNYFVRNEPIQNGSRGLVGYVNYLQDKEHRNHKDRTSEIIHLHGNEDNFLDTVVGEADRLQLQRDKAKKGGRPISSLAQSYVFGMPERFVGKPTKKQYQAMAKDMLKVIAEKLDLPLASLKNHCFINVHVNKNNPHINIVVGRIIDGQNYEKILTRPSTTNALKRESSRTVKRHLGLDIGKYKPIVPIGTTTGPRWAENEKYKKALNFYGKIAKDTAKTIKKELLEIDKIKDQKVIDWFKGVNAASEHLKRGILALSEGNEDLALENEKNARELITGVNRARINLNSLPFDVQVQLSELAEKVGEEIETFNENKNTKRNIRSLKMSF